MNLVHLDQTLEKATTLKQAETLFAKYLASFGFRCYAISYYEGSFKANRKLRYDYVSEPLRPWHNHYLEQNYADVDRTLEESHLTTLPVFWDVQEQLAQAKSGREKRIRLESIKYGIDKGLSVQLHGPNNDFVTLTLHQFSKETCLKDYKKHQYEWLSATHIFYHAIYRILHLQQNACSLYKLTKRERQCLELTAKLWRVEQIANELGISTRTVNFHIQNANKKIGTNSKYQSIAKL